MIHGKIPTGRFFIGSDDEGAMMIAMEYQRLWPPSPFANGELIVTTKTGRAVTARPLDREDASLLVDLFTRLSERTRRLRFSKPRSTAELVWHEATRLTNSDPQADTTLVGVVREEGEDRAVALVQIVHVGATIAEIAAVVRDDYQNEGLGKAICRLAAQVAMARGVRTLEILTQAENKAVQWLVRGTGLAYTSEMRRGEVTIFLHLPVS
jgi:RimJ/RimL family protein N-acetyltransferase